MTLAKPKTTAKTLKTTALIAGALMCLGAGPTQSADIGEVVEQAETSWITFSLQLSHISIDFDHDGWSVDVLDQPGFGLLIDLEKGPDVRLEF